MNVEEWQPSHGLGLGAAQDVGIDLCSSDVRMAHEFLYGEYRHASGQQHDAEGVPRRVEGGGFLYPGSCHPFFQYPVGPLVRHGFENRRACPCLSSQQRLGTVAERQALAGAGLVLEEFYAQPLAVMFHILPSQGFHVAETQPRHTGEQKHRLYVAVLAVAPCAYQLVDVLFCEVAFLLLGLRQPPHTLQYPVVEKALLAGVVKHARQLLKVQPGGILRHALGLHIAYEVLQVICGDGVQCTVAVAHKVLDHQTVRAFRDRLDPVTGNKIQCVVRKAYLWTLHCLPAAQAGGILVLPVL